MQQRMRCPPPCVSRSRGAKINLSVPRVYLLAVILAATVRFRLKARKSSQGQDRDP